jgi:hypothetical protein
LGKNENAEAAGVIVARRSYYSAQRLDPNRKGDSRPLEMPASPSPTGAEVGSTEAGKAHAVVPVAEWLAALILSGTNRREVAAARLLLRHLLDTTGEALPAPRQPSLILSLVQQRSGTVCAGHRDAEVVARWLAREIVAAAASPASTAAQLLLHLLLDDKGCSNGQRAAANALVWMVLHTRPKDRLSRRQREGLLKVKGAHVGTDWAAMELDRYVIRPLLKGGRWRQRCRVAEQIFGFAFPDAALNFLWERIEKYRSVGHGFGAWAETVLAHYWTSLYREWKRWTPKGSKAAAELAASADDDGGERSRDRRPRKRAPQGFPTPASAAGSRASSLSPEPLSPSDVAKLKVWDPLDGLLMGFETDLWRRIPRSLWEDWRIRLKISPRSLRDVTFAARPDRRALLAKVTEQKRNTLDQRWRRLKPKIAALQCVAALLRRPDDAL